MLNAGYYSSLPHRSESGFLSPFGTLVFTTTHDDYYDDHYCYYGYTRRLMFGPVLSVNSVRLSCFLG